MFAIFKKKDCERCGKIFQPKSSTSKYCDKCRPLHIKNYIKDYAKTHKDILKARDKRYYEKNKKEIAKRRRKRALKLKAEVIAQYSNGSMACVCCGERGHILFLTIDHIHGNGREERRKLNIHSGLGFYRWLKKNNYPDGGYQVLCYNCNCAKYHNNGICPHQIKIKSIER